MRDNRATHHPPRPTTNQTPYLTPYLGLRARLSQIWINRWTVLFILILVRLIFLTQSTHHSLDSARREAMSACTQVENIGSTMASMPHYMSQGINELTAAGVEKAVNGLLSMLGMTVSGVEEIVLFVIHMMTSTYLCLITLAVSGSLHAAVEIGNDVATALNKTIESVTGDIGDQAKSVTDGINDLMSVFNKIKGIPGVPDGTIKTPKIDLNDDIDKLKSLSLPTELETGLQNLNKSIPTFQDVQNFTDSIIRLPFEEVKGLISGMQNFTFNRTLFPVPKKDQLTFCSDGDDINKFFNGLAETVAMARKAAIGILIAAAILVCIPMVWTEVRRWRRMNEHVGYLDKGHSGMDVAYMVSRPHSSRIGMWVGSKFGSGHRRDALRWAWAYATTFPMLALLALGLAGLLSALCQYLILRELEEKVPELTSKVAGFADKVVGSLNNASMSWSHGVNGALGTLDHDINDNLLGWVNTTTTTVNGTLNGFVDKMSDTLNSTFGDTMLYDPIKDVLNCLIGLKIAGVQKGLTWVQDHAHVEFPEVRNDTFSLGTLAKVSDSTSAAQLLSDPSGKTEDEVTEALTWVIDNIKHGIMQEAAIAGVLVALWLITALGGLAFAIFVIIRRRNAPPSGHPYVIDPDIDQARSPLAAPVQTYPDMAAPPYEYQPPKPAPFNHSRPLRTHGPDDDEVESPTEKVGRVGHAVSESARPGHLRASSHGDLARLSPSDEKNNPFNGPFDSPYDKRRQI